MTYEIDTANRFVINWNSKGKQRILQNVINLLNTYMYETAYARTTGMDPGWIDSPAPEAAAKSSNSIISLIAAREPRAKVKQVKYLGSAKDGSLRMKVVVEI